MGKVRFNTQIKESGIFLRSQEMSRTLTANFMD